MFIAAVALVALSSLVPQAQACRCASKSLDEYFAQAELVGFVKLNGWQASEVGYLTLSVSSVTDLFKGALAGRALVTADSTAACGLPLRKGGHYLLFAYRDESREGTLAVDTCSGSRSFDARVEQPLPDVGGVPAPLVPIQLAMLQGAEALRAQHAVAPHQRIIGLLDLKPLSHGGTVLARARPAADAPVVARIDDMSSLASREATYEFPAAVVVGREAGWYALRLRDEDPTAVAWVDAHAAGTYWDLPALLLRRLTYLTPAWDGLLWPDGPGAGRVLRLRRARETPITVEQTKLLGGSLWLEVSVLASSPCEGGGGKVRARGWVAAHSSAGAPTAWYYSRGC